MRLLQVGTPPGTPNPAGAASLGQDKQAPPEPADFVVRYPGIQPGPPQPSPPAAATVLPSSLRTNAPSRVEDPGDPPIAFLGGGPANYPPEWVVTNNTQRNDVRFQQDTGFHHDVPDEQRNHQGVVGRNWDRIPAVPNGPGAGAGGFMLPARNPYNAPVISDSDRERHKERDEARDRKFQTALHMDIGNANERTEQSNRARDARNGVNVVTGRGAWPASTTTPQLSEANPIIGKGSVESQTGVPMSLDFTTSDETELFARSLLHGGMPIDSGTGKPWAGRPKIDVYCGNPGIKDSPTLGPCCVTTIHGVVALHANYTHTSQQTKERALKQNLLAKVSKEIRPLLATYDQEGSWLGLVGHFLQTCGPPDILSTVYRMLEEARYGNPPRTLRVRVQTLFFSWKVAHFTCFNSNPERDTRVVHRASAHCTPFNHPFEQHAALKDLIMRCDTSLWNSFCGNTARGLRQNPSFCFNLFCSWTPRSWAPWSSLSCQPRSPASAWVARAAPILIRQPERRVRRR